MLAPTLAAELSPTPAEPVADPVELVLAPVLAPTPVAALVPVDELEPVLAPTLAHATGWERGRRHKMPPNSSLKLGELRKRSNARTLPMMNPSSALVALGLSCGLQAFPLLLALSGAGLILASDLHAQDAAAQVSKKREPPLLAEESPQSIQDIIGDAHRAFAKATSTDETQAVETSCQRKLADAVQKERERLTARAIALTTEDKFDAVDNILARERDLDAMGADFRERVCTSPLNADAGPSKSLPESAMVGAELTRPTQATPSNRDPEEAKNFVNLRPSGRAAAPNDPPAEIAEEAANRNATEPPPDTNAMSPTDPDATAAQTSGDAVPSSPQHAERAAPAPSGTAAVAASPTISEVRRMHRSRRASLNISPLLNSTRPSRKMRPSKRQV
jgi:hypothetical protein